MAEDASVTRQPFGSQNLPLPVPNPLVCGGAAPPFPAFHARAPWWGGDLQTLRNVLQFTSVDLSVAQARLGLPLADGDELIALLNMPAADTGKPVIVLIHGLTGDENSRNICTSAAYHLARGFPVIRLNLRGAGPSLGHCRGHYHAGRSDDLRQALPHLPEALCARGVLLVGVSLGGNMLLKFLAEWALPMVRAAAAVSAPIDLKRAQACLMRPRNAIYHRHLLRTMKADAMRAGHVGADIVAGIASIYEFDDRIVAPSNGFANAEDYYARSSAAPLLGKIRTPTLAVHAADDPWIPAGMYTERAWPSAGPVTLLMPPSGGHVGFHDRDDRWPWHDRCIGQFFDTIAFAA